MPEEYTMQATSSRCRVHENRGTLAAKFFPAKSSCQTRRRRRRFRDQHGLCFEFLELRRISDGSPEMVFNNKKFGVAMGQQLQDVPPQ